MRNTVTIICPVCDAKNVLEVPDAMAANQIVHCTACDHALTTGERLQAQIAAEALGLGAGEARDDHVPLQDRDDPPT